MKLIEKDLEFDFTDAINAFVFDQMDQSLPNYHEVNNMHKVDFLVELENAILFVEVKDPSIPGADAASLQSFQTKIQNGKLADSFASKFIDTFLYRWAEKELNKPVYYINLVTLDEAQVNYLEDKIVKKIPPLGINVSRWQRQLFENCQVFNLEMWNDNFPKWPVTRISQSGTN